MSWQNHKHTHELVDRQCKIRKRGGSSSSSSSLVRRYRLKRAILVGKRVGSSTPVPTWKSPCSVMMENGGGGGDDEFGKQRRPASKEGGGGGKGKEVVAVSARKLAATLWEINEEVNPSKNKDSKGNKEMRSREGSLPTKLSDPSYTPISERNTIGSEGAGHQRRLSAISQKLHLTTDYYLGGFDENHRTASLTEMQNVHVKDQSLGKPDRKRANGFKTSLKEVCNGLSTSKELLKVLTRVWGLEGQQTLSSTLLSALRAELDRARVQVHQMVREQQSDCNEIEYLMKRFAEEKSSWKSKEREKIRAAIACIAEELEVEKKLRRQTERLNKKLGKELADKEADLLKATKELEREKRAKEIFEQVCDELATGLGQDRAEVEELKRESEKVREEVEKEREMLQLADVLREERVQMKLSEAKYHFEEKNAAVEQLKNELEAHLRSKRGQGSGYSPDFKRIKELEAYLKKINFGSFQHAKKEENGIVEVAYREEFEGDDSSDSDLHSIELNMDNNKKICKWSYACGDDTTEDDSKRTSVDKQFKGRKSLSSACGDDTTEDGSKRTSVDKQFKGRRSLSEKIQWESICLNKNSGGFDWEFGIKTQGHSDGHVLEISELVPQTQTPPEHETETKKTGSVRGLTDHRLTTSKVVPIPMCASDMPVPNLICEGAW